MWFSVKTRDNVNVSRSSQFITPMKLLVVAILIAAILPGCVRRPIHSATDSPQTRADHALVHIGLPNGEVRELPLERYVRHAVLGEVPLSSLAPDARQTMAEVQIILARTYASHNIGRHANEGFDLCSTTHCQVYRDTVDSRSEIQAVVDRAQERTRNVVITYNNRPIEAVFHANCGGATSPSSSVWGGISPPYLSGVDDHYCLPTDDSSWTFSVSREELRATLNTNIRTAVGSRLELIRIIERDNAGRVTKLEIAGSRDLFVRGEQLRGVVANSFGWSAFKSARFTVTERDGQFHFAGNGYGHGTGLCQIGAMARARAGHNVSAILLAYFPETGLSDPNTGNLLSDVTP